jgi:hypothetical protein
LYARPQVHFFRLRGFVVPLELFVLQGLIVPRPQVHFFRLRGFVVPLELPSELHHHNERERQNTKSKRDILITKEKAPQPKRKLLQNTKSKRNIPITKEKAPQPKRKLLLLVLRRYCWFQSRRRCSCWNHRPCFFFFTNGRRPEPRRRAPESFVRGSEPSSATTMTYSSPLLDRRP